MGKQHRSLFLLSILGGIGLGYALFFRKKIFRWGIPTGDEQQSLPGDELVPSPVLNTTRGIVIQAPPEKVWPWLVQIGQGRGGFYSYDWLENLFGMNIHNANRIIPEFQQLRPGDLIPFWQNAGVRVIEIDPCRALVLAGNLYGSPEEQTEPVGYGGSWIFVLREITPGTTRLMVRSMVADFEPRWLCRLFTWLLLEPTHFIMEMGMLRGIKRRVEAVG